MGKNYNRVIPRDFFNEAKLLKCMGMLSLKILDNQTPVKIEINENGDPFEIFLHNSGCLEVINYTVLIEEKPVQFVTTYNSKEPHPFYAVWEYEEFPVFTDNGEFTKKFIRLCNLLKSQRLES